MSINLLCKLLRVRHFSAVWLRQYDMVEVILTWRSTLNCTRKITIIQSHSRYLRLQILRCYYDGWLMLIKALMLDRDRYWLIHYLEITLCEVTIVTIKRKDQSKNSLKWKRNKMQRLWCCHISWVTLQTWRVGSILNVHIFFPSKQSELMASTGTCPANLPHTNVLPSQRLLTITIQCHLSTVEGSNVVLYLRGILEWNGNFGVVVNNRPLCTTKMRFSPSALFLHAVEWKIVLGWLFFSYDM